MHPPIRQLARITPASLINTLSGPTAQILMNNHTVVSSQTLWPHRMVPCRFHMIHWLLAAGVTQAASVLINNTSTTGNANTHFRITEIILYNLAVSI